ncbi:nuclear transport factor 2 family protein [Streptomyces hainanensis]|uniref:Uncharacterized protein n=1 Tax=Streptomyces hainanensis TaxID=402648 RepID=A0A4R4ST78_9ACTN|nr:nuclear transport factor 2 family protein [Streptomyces hainanensis]TDC67287.1 hypothetical protein E1283_29015 [Streptomyces hainanensis]
MSYGDDYDDTRAGGVSAGTRTRLPEQRESAARRQPASTGRSLAAIVGVVVLLLGAIVFASRTGGDGGGGGGGAGDDRDPDRAQATAPSGEAPVDTSTNGIPVGHPATEQGAQSAAANYAVALGGTEMFDPQRRPTIVNTVYAPDVAAAQAAEYERTYTDPDFLTRIGLSEVGAAPSGTTFVARVNPVGTSIVEFDGDTARVAVWYSTLFGLAGADSRNPVTEGWYTTTYDLVRVEDDWKITDFDEQEGPAPVGRDQRASTAEEMADAVEQFGGFTYAR